MSGTQLPQIVTPPPGPRSRELAGRLARVESPAFEARRDHRAEVSGEDQGAIVYASGVGSNVFDVDGNRYIDGVSSLWVLVHGHGKRELTDAIDRQSKMLCHSTLLGLANTPAIVLAHKLVDIAPRGLEKVFYSFGAWSGNSYIDRRSCCLWRSSSP